MIEDDSHLSIDQPLLSAQQIRSYYDELPSVPVFLTAKED
jgi:hypothetical protein